MGVWVVPSPGRRDAAPDGRVNQLSSLVGALAGALAELLPLVCGALPVAESGAVCGGAWPVVPSGVGSFLAGDDEGWVSFPVPAASLERPPPFLFSHGFLRQGDALLIGEDKPVAIDMINALLILCPTLFSVARRACSSRSAAVSGLPLDAGPTPVISMR